MPREVMPRRKAMRATTTLIGVEHGSIPLSSIAPGYTSLLLWVQAMLCHPPSYGSSWLRSLLRPRLFARPLTHLAALLLGRTQARRSCAPHPSSPCSAALRCSANTMTS